MSLSTVATTPAATLPVELTDVATLMDEFIRDLSSSHDMLPMKQMRQSYHSIHRIRQQTTTQIKQTIKSLTHSIQALNVDHSQSALAELQAQTRALEVNVSDIKSRVNDMQSEQNKIQERIKSTQSKESDWFESIKGVDERRQKDIEDLTRRIRLYRLVSSIEWKRDQIDEHNIVGVFHSNRNIKPFHYVISDTAASGSELDGTVNVAHPADIANHLWAYIAQQNEEAITSRRSSE